MRFERSIRGCSRLPRSALVEELPTIRPSPLVKSTWLLRTVSAMNPRTLVLVTSSSHFQSSSGLRCSTPAFCAGALNRLFFFVCKRLNNYTVDEDAQLEL
jgi:hypothetical protein